MERARAGLLHNLRGMGWPWSVYAFCVWVCITEMNLQIVIDVCNDHLLRVVRCSVTHCRISKLTHVYPHDACATGSIFQISANLLEVGKSACVHIWWNWHGITNISARHGLRRHLGLDTSCPLWRIYPSTSKPLYLSRSSIYKL
jgi:hypothetical protein